MGGAGVPGGPWSGDIFMAPKIPQAKVHLSPFWPGQESPGSASGTSVCDQQRESLPPQCDCCDILKKK